MIEERINNIEKRNLRVECDKAWETSYVRRVSIAFFTYIVATIWLHIIGNSHPFLDAVVPTVGYLLSTISLPIVKTLWIKYFYKKQ